MFKKKSRPTATRKPVDNDDDDEQHAIDDHNRHNAIQPDKQPSATHHSDSPRSPALSLEDALALRHLRKTRQGIDASKLAMGEKKKKRKRVDDNEEEVDEDLKTTPVKYGLQPGARDEDSDPLANEEAKARRTVRTNNFTQQTNALDVDKHMMAYIEETLKARRQMANEDANEPSNGQGLKEELLKFEDMYKTQNTKLQEGSVTSSLAMLTAIPEVDLGMDARLKNIEETEKAKRAAAEERERQQPSKISPDEAHLVATRFYNPHLQHQSEAQMLRNAKLEAMGKPPAEPKQRHDRPQMATDEIVMERFRKRMRK